MASFNVVGFEDIEKALLRREAAAAAAVPKMLEAGAEVLVRGQQETIARMGIIDTGDMQASVKAGKIVQTDTGASVDVYPQGKDRKGVLNATKAFVHQYGKSNLPARPWLSVANATYAQGVHDAMREAWEAMNNA